MNALAPHFSFDGRVRRSTFWWTQLGLLGCGVVLLLVVLAGIALMRASPVVSTVLVVALSLSVAVAMSWVSWAVAIKRAHDLGHTGWITLLFLVPLVSLVFWLYLGFAAGHFEDNSYGPVP